MQPACTGSKSLISTLAFCPEVAEATQKGKRYSEEQITYALRQAEGGTPVAEVCRQLGVSEASFYLWKKKYGKLGITEIRELRQLRDENTRLKRLVAAT